MSPDPPGTTLRALEARLRTAQPIDKLLYEGSPPIVLSILSTGPATPDIGLTPKWEYRRMCFVWQNRTAWLYGAGSVSRQSATVGALSASLFSDSQEPSVFFGDLARLLKSASTFGVQTQEVALDFADIEFEVLPNEIGIFARGFRVTRNERPGRRKARSSGGTRSKNHGQNYTRPCPKPLRPPVQQTPYPLAYMRDARLIRGGQKSAHSTHDISCASIV